MLKREAFTEEQRRMICQTLGLGGVIARLKDVDFTRGCGVISNQLKYLWTKDKCRITLVYDRGTIIASCSKSPDPEWPEEAYVS